MAGFQIKFLAQQFGEKEISSAIAKLRLRLDNVRPVLDQIGQLYLKNTKRRFDSQTDPQGKVWKWNTKTTQFYKSRGLPAIGSYPARPPAKGPNVRGIWTKKLYDSLKYRMAGNTVVVGVKGSEVPYATTFHFGVTEKGKFSTKTIGNWTVESPWGVIPARPFVGTNKKTNEAVLKILRNYLDVTANTPQWPVGFPRS